MLHLASSDFCSGGSHSVHCHWVVNLLDILNPSWNSICLVSLVLISFSESAFPGTYTRPESKAPLLLAMFIRPFLTTLSSPFPLLPALPHLLMEILLGRDSICEEKYLLLNKSMYIQYHVKKISLFFFLQTDQRINQFAENLPTLGCLERARFLSCVLQRALCLKEEFSTL